MSEGWKVLIACPICGKYHERGKCDPKTLAAIDAAMKREDYPEPPRTVGSRLSEGFGIMATSGDM